MLNKTDAVSDLDDIALGKIPLFARLSRKQLTGLKRFLHCTYFDAGDVVLAEGALSRDRIFIITEGEVSVWKTGVSPLTQEAIDYELEVRGKGEVFGAMSVIDGKPLGVSVTARTPVTIAVLSLKSHRRNAMCRKIRNILIAELRRSLSDYVRTAIEQKADSLRQEAEFSRYRNSVGSIVIAALSLLSVYTLALGLMPRFEDYLGVNFALSPFIIVLFAAIFLPIIAKSKFPPAFFGLRLDNWRSALVISALGSAAFIGVCVFVKWIVIETSPAMAGTPLINSPELRIGGTPTLTIASPVYWLIVALYLLLTPVQEFVARCGVQAPLYAFLHGPEWERRMWSILVSNLVFSAAHAHISLGFAIAAFIPGLFWGWIFARTNSLLAASVSHFLIGGAGVFLFDMESFFEKLF
jgi:CRP-like cAMP-binding protein